MAIESLCKVTEVSKSNLLDFLDNFEPHERDSLDNSINDSFIRPFNLKQKSFTCAFFHGTRLAKENFKALGLRSLNDELDNLWQSLYQLFPEEKALSTFTNEIEKFDHGHHYTNKTNNSIHWGPYGFLNKAFALKPQKGHHFYLSIPEIIEDIFNAYKNKTGKDLSKKYKELSKPYLVKFKAEAEINFLGFALAYIFNSQRPQPDYTLSQAAYDGYGSSIPPNDILEVTQVKLA